jgi:hypothetical protein
MATFNKCTAIAVAALAACGTAAASEDYDLRYAPGVGGADLSAPFEAGWVFQAPAYAYSGNIRSTSTVATDLTSTLAGLGVTLPGAGATTVVKTNTQINVWGLLPRLSYMGSTKFLGATLGATALVPVITKANHSSVTAVATTLNATAAQLPAAYQSALVSGVDTAATSSATALTAGNSNKAFGLGDLELSPILRWSTDTSQTLFIVTVIAPTGDYKSARAANPSAGHFWTIRPALQYSYIGDGWDVGARAAFSANTRDDATHYHTGNYLNLDAVLMKSLSDSTRVGLAAYAVDQLTRDSRTEAPANPVYEARQDATLDKKGHVYGVGPELAYIHGAGDYLVDGRLLKEFGAQTRPKGFTAFLTLSKPF